MVTFMESEPPLRGYMKQIKPERIHESWKSNLEGKMPLELVSSKSL